MVHTFFNAEKRESKKLHGGAVLLGNGGVVWQPDAQKERLKSIVSAASEAALDELDASLERLRKARSPSTTQSSASKFRRSNSEKVTPTNESGRGRDQFIALSGREALKRSWTTSLSTKAEEIEKPQIESEEEEEEELPQGRRPRASSDASSVGRKSDTSSVNWRADALDVGENLAAEAAAKKGHTSIDSIVALVEAERERWDEEKQALEAKVEEFKEQLRSMQAQHSPDAEKQALKAQYQELRKAMNESAQPIRRLGLCKAYDGK